MVGCKGGRGFGVGFAAWAVKMGVKEEGPLSFLRAFVKEKICPACHLTG